MKKLISDRRIYGLLLMMLFFVLECLSTEFYRGDIWKACYLIIGLLGNMALLGFIRYREIFGIDDNDLYQINIICFIAIPFILALLSEGSKLFWKYDVLGGVAVETTMFFLLVVLLYAVYTISRYLNLCISTVLGNIYTKIRNNTSLMILIIAIVILSYDKNWRQFKWDGGIYYNIGKSVNVFSLSSLGIVGHLCQAYAFLYKTADIILGHAGFSFLVMNILLLVVSIIYFYKIIKELVPNMNNGIYTIITCLYAFSPFSLGMVNYYSPDYMFMCLLFPLVYFTIKKSWIFHFACAIFFVFTKEPAIVAYFGLCMGVLLTDYLAGNKFRDIVLMAKYYYMMLVGIVWFLLYRILGAWTVGRTAQEDFGFQKGYVLEKLKVLYLMNFSWLLFLFAVIGLVFLGKKIIRNICPMFLSMILFTIFSCYFVTSNHPRYAAIIPAGITLTTGLTLCRLAGSAKRRIMVGLSFGVIALLLLISCYITLDPVSKLCFDTVNIGETTMITTGTKNVGDAMVYNKQALGLEPLICEGVEYAIDNAATILFVGERAMFYDDGIAQESRRIGGYKELLEYWDPKYRVRSSLDQYEKLDVIVTESFESLPQGRYCYINILGDCHNDFMPEHGCEVIDSKELNYRGWKTVMYIFEK